MPDLTATADEVRAALPCCKDPADPVLTIVPCGDCYPCRIRDSWLALHAALAAKDAENERLRGALLSIAGARQEGDDWDHPDFDWRLLARQMESIARTALADGESDGMSGHPRPPIPFGPRCSFWGCVKAATRYVGRWSFCDAHGGAS